MPSARPADAHCIRGRAWLLSMCAATQRCASCAVPGNAGAPPASAAAKPWCCARCCSCAYPAKARSGDCRPPAPAALPLCGAASPCRAAMAASLHSGALSVRNEWQVCMPLHTPLELSTCLCLSNCDNITSRDAPLAVQVEAECKAVRKHIDAGF